MCCLVCTHHARRDVIPAEQLWGVFGLISQFPSHVFQPEIQSQLLYFLLSFIFFLPSKFGAGLLQGNYQTQSSFTLVTQYAS